MNGRKNVTGNPRTIFDSEINQCIISQAALIQKWFSIAIKGKHIQFLSFPLGIVALLLHTFFSCIASSSCLNSSVALKIFCSAFSISSCSCDSRVCAANLKTMLTHTHTRNTLNSEILLDFPFQ